ncbi:MAG: ATP-binding protein [Desulfobacteraceae bacterium]|nr:ATP-binding protein [Desulfobacteraceae bacterium]
MKIVSKILFLVIISITLVMGGVSYLIVQKTQEIVHNQIDHLLTTSLELGKAKILQAADDIKKTTEIVAHNRAIIKSLFLQLSRGTSQILNEMVVIYPFYNYIMIVETDGNIFASSTRDNKGNKIAGEQLLGLNFSNNPLFCEPSPNKTTIGNPGPDPFLSLIEMGPRMSQWFITPVLKRGELIGWIVVSYNWQKELSALLADIMHQLKAVGNPTLDVVLTDETGNIVVGTKPSEKTFVPSPDKLWKKKQLTFGKSSMSLIIANDKAKTYQPVIKTRNLLIVIIFSSALLLITALYFILQNTFLRRLKALQVGAEELGKGNLNYKVGTDSKDEIGQLSRAFDKMTEDLKKTTTSIDELNKEINERKRAEKALRNSEARIRAIVNTAVDGIITIDEHGIIQSFNPSAERLFGYAEEEAIGQNVEILMPSPYREAHDSYIANYLRTGETKIIGIGRGALARRRDGTTFPIDLAVSEVYRGKQRVFTGIIRNITERKDAEEALHNAKEEAEAANLAKTEFLSSMSHEIRTPMNAIIGVADLLRETSLTPEQQTYVQMFASAGNNLLNIINDILDISKVEAGQLDLAEIDFNLHEVVEKVCEVMALHANEKGLELTCHVAPDVQKNLIGDPTRLRQVLINLIGNAVKFTEKGDIFVEVNKHNQGAKDDLANDFEVIVSVKDTGIGIPLEKVEVIFDRFTQVDSSTTRSHGGTGLGLTISKQLVEMMGGRIWVESKQGQGSTFYFTAKFGLQTEPGRHVEPPPAVIIPAAFEDLRTLNILLVEDSEDNRLLIQSYLKKTPYHIEIAENGEIAVEKFESGKYDLVLMDMQMPVMNGYSATREIRKWENQKGVKATPVIALTAYATKEERQKSLDAGCTAHLTKPIRKATLLEAIYEYTANKPNKD